ncbi:MAG: type II CRISPR-associated endonuclease Cas1 [Coriobacteriaceae bacterium]|nr:type II CRISPR-associated endonuclease Cas1 [Coriobacteriaceae bacterium]
MSFRTVFIESQCRCSYQGGYMVVRKEDDTAKVHLSEVSSIVLQTEQVYLSAYLLAELAKSKISLVVSDEKCNPVGQYLPLYGAHNTSKRIVEQLDWGEPIKKRVWQRVVREKIRQQARFLEERDYPEARILFSAISEVRSGDTTNREAQAARVYFEALFGSGFNRNADIPLNAALNYGYAILLSMVNREIVSRGYLTQCGICHRNEYNQFNLACDLMEPFRPAVDKLVVDFFVGEFDLETKRVLADLANKGMAYKGGTYRFASVVSLYVQDCLNALNKRIAVDDIEPFEIL